MLRRSVAVFLGLGLLALTACSSDNGGSATNNAGPSTGGAGGAGGMPGTGGMGGSGGTGLFGPDEWNRDVTPPSDGEAATKRAACDYKKGALPAETQGKSHPNGDEIPIDHIVLFMKENRSFDHMFQKLPEYGQPDVEVAPANFSNLDANGVEVPIFHDKNYCFVDTAHSWGPVHEQINGGAMDGFVTSNDDVHELPAHGTLDMLSGNRAMAYYDESDLPFYYWLANEFAIADHYHCSLQGPTWPNRMYFYAASSFGNTANSFAPDPETLLVDYLEKRKITWKVYVSSIAGLALFPTTLFDYAVDHFVPIAEFFTDAKNGTLPQVAYVDPGIAQEGFGENDEHPPAMVTIGEKFTAEVIEAMTKSPLWERSALFITYDEHGGLYDHVEPPPACAPDDHQPKLDPGDPPGKFDHLGVRVPMIVVSPYAKKHFVGHRTYDHTSIVRFVEARFIMPALTNRDANAEAPWEMFDFENPPHKNPPAITIPKLNQAKIDACRAIFEE